VIELANTEVPNPEPDGAELPSTELGRAFARRVTLRQALVGVVAFMIVGLLAPWSLMLESDRLAQVWAACLQAGGIGVVIIVLLSQLSMRRARRVIESLALEPEKVEPAEVGALVGLPFALTAIFVLVGSAAALAMAVGPMRPERFDDARAIGLCLLTITIVCAAAVAHYVAIRDATIRSIELAPLEPITAWLERDALRLAPRARFIRKFLMAMAVPVALSGVGTVLVAHAHLRAFVEDSRHQTALVLTRTALDPLPGDEESGRDDAVAAAAAHGFSLQHAPREPSDEPVDEVATQTHLESGQQVTRLSLPYGDATVRYSAQLSAEAVMSGVWWAVLAVLVAAALGIAFGWLLADDLQLATQQVTSLGTEAVLSGRASVARPARFEVVAELGGAVEALAERFRVFAAAQERALEAKAASRRMKQLLFASVSHDLKSPLNAILGFAELVRDEPLSPPQQESLALVSGRGRELLALIETFLDAARVEAGQLQLMPAPVEADDLVAEALAKARDLCPVQNLEVRVEMARGIPPVLVDPTHVGRALGVLIAHATEGAGGARSRAVRLRGSLPARERYDGDGFMCLDIEHAADANRPSLLEAQLAGKIPKATGRGMVLRLSLARAILELSGGAVVVGRGPHGAAVVTCFLPLVTLQALPAEEGPTLVMRGRGQPAEEVQAPTLIMPRRER
jgi:signal transduction histidine kinase